MAKRKAPKKSTKETSPKKKQTKKSDEKTEQKNDGQPSTTNNDNVSPKKSSLKKSSSPKKKVRFSKHNDQIEIEARVSEPEEEPTGYAKLMQLVFIEYSSIKMHLVSS